MSALNAPPVVGDLLALFDHMDPTRSHEAKPSERLRRRYAERRTFRTFAIWLAAVIAFALIVAAAHAIPRPAVATDSPSPNGAAAAGNLSPQEQAK